MHEQFRLAVESLVPSFDRLMAMEPVRGSSFPLGGRPRSHKIPGVYLMSEGERHLYVGRSNNIAARFAAHRRESSGDGVAAFAFRLACISSNRTAISYKAGHPDTRAGKMACDVFKAHFSQAKERIRSMDFRYVEEIDPIRQALLEMYCAVTLGTPHNTFDNH